MTITSIAHITFIDPPNPICAACNTDAFPASAMQPAFCCECVDAMLRGRDNRLIKPAFSAPGYDELESQARAFDAAAGNPRCGCGEPATVRVGADACATYCQACAYPTPDMLLAAHAAAWWSDMDVPGSMEGVNATYEAYLAGGGTDAHYDAHWRATSDAARLAVADPPPGMPDDDGSPDGGGPPNNRTARPRCHCGAVATIWDDVRHLCAPHYLAPVRTPDPALGRDLMRLRWHKYASFVAMLINAEPDRLHHYASSYAAFVRTHNPASTIDASLVLARWAREMDHNGPAAPAMRVAA